MSRSSTWHHINRAVARFSTAVTLHSGGTLAFAAALALVVVWLALGPLFDFSDSWQLVINTTTTIVTFLMVFLIQRAQNKDARATNIKLNEIIAAIDGASNRLIEVEDLSEEELDTLRDHFHSLSRMAKRDSNLTKSHSVEEAKTRHHAKSGRRVRAAGDRPGRPASRRGRRSGKPAPPGRAETA
jgi:low affinity Fe/Cu permease